MRLASVIANLSLLFAVPALGRAQESSSLEGPPEGETLRAVSETVVVDFVVRDRSGRLLRDLRPDEVQVFDAGAPKAISSLRLIEGERSTSAFDDGSRPEAADPGTAYPGQVHLVSLVFDRLGYESRPGVRESAAAFVRGLRGDRVFAAVFSVDERLHVLQEFTRDREKLIQAIAWATSGTRTEVESLSASVRNLLEEQSRTRRAVEAELAAGRQFDAEAMGRLKMLALEYALSDMLLGMLRFADTGQDLRISRNSLFSLISLVREQRRLAGRKAIVYFSEGLTVPPNQVDYFRGVIDESNRANVTFYSVDARGLLTDSLMASSRETLLQALEASRQQLLNPAGFVTREQALLSEAGEASLRQNTQGVLDDLSRATGGFLIANTNDFRPGLDRVLEEVGTYYELTYVPEGLVYDGSFRPIEVRVSRPGVTVQARNGYFALPPDTDSPLEAFEIPLLTALGASPPPAALAHRASVLRFPSDSDDLTHTIALEIPLRGISFDLNAGASLYRTRFSLLSLVKDGEGHVVKRFSHDYPLEGPLDKVDSLRKGSVFYLRNFVLDPGRYHLESAVHDHLTGASGVTRQVLMVPERSAGPALSSLVLVRRGDPDSGENPEAEDNPLLVRGIRITPQLEEELPEDTRAGVSLYLVVCPKRSADGWRSAPELTLSLVRDGRVLVQSRPVLPEPDDRGRIPYFASLPLEGLGPGRYEIVAHLRQGAATAVESAFFRIR